jgi:hypothetical protein
MITIRYFIPEDGDSETQPNVFLAPKPRQQGYPPTLGEVKQCFPLPGRYHFRFKAPLVPGTDRDKGALPVWMDCTDDRQPVFVWKSQVIAKVTRIGVEEEDDDDDDDEDFRRPVQQQPPQRQHSQAHSTTSTATPPVVQHSAPSFDLFDATPSTGHHQQQPHQRQYSSSSSNAAEHRSSSGGAPNLLDGHVPAAATTATTLLDMNSHSYSQHSHTPAPVATHNDFLGMTTPPVSGNFNNYGPAQQQPQQPTMNHQQQQPAAQRTFDTFGSQQGGPFGGLGTPWKT